MNWTTCVPHLANNKSIIVNYTIGLNTISGSGMALKHMLFRYQGIQKRLGCGLKCDKPLSIAIYLAWVKHILFRYKVNRKELGVVWVRL